MKTECGLHAGTQPILDLGSIAGGWARTVLYRISHTSAITLSGSFNSVGLSEFKISSTTLGKWAQPIFTGGCLSFSETLEGRAVIQIDRVYATMCQMWISVLSIPYCLFSSIWMLRVLRTYLYETVAIHLKWETAPATRAVTSVFSPGAAGAHRSRRGCPEGDAFLRRIRRGLRATE